MPVPTTGGDSMRTGVARAWRRPDTSEWPGEHRLRHRVDLRTRTPSAASTARPGGRSGHAPTPRTGPARLSAPGLPVAGRPRLTPPPALAPQGVRTLQQRGPSRRPPPTDQEEHRELPGA